MIRRPPVGVGRPAVMGTNPPASAAPPAEQAFHTWWEQPRPTPVNGLSWTVGASKFDIAALAWLAAWTDATRQTARAQRDDDLQWIRAYARDCGCSERIEAAIRGEQ